MKIVLQLFSGIVLSVFLLLGSCKDSNNSNNSKEISIDKGTKKKTLRDSQLKTQTLSNVAFGWDIRFTANKAVEIDRIANGINLKFVGPNSKPQTEITDGYYITITLAKAKTILEYTESVNALGTDKKERLGDYKATVFKTRSELNNQLITHYAYNIRPESDIIVDISVSLYGKNTVDYKSQVQRLLDSITWIDSTE